MAAAIRLQRVIATSLVHRFDGGFRLVPLSTTVPHNFGTVLQRSSTRTTLYLGCSQRLFDTSGCAPMQDRRYERTPRAKGKKALLGRHTQPPPKKYDDDDEEQTDGPAILLNMGKVVAEMNAQYHKFRETLASNLSTRLDLRTIEQIEVKLPSGKVPLNHVGKVVLKNPQLVSINFYQPEALKPAKTALELSGMGLNPQQQGQVVLVQLAQVTREKREQLAKGAKTLLNQYLQKLNKVYSDHSRRIEQAKLEKTSTPQDCRDAIEELLTAKRRFALMGEDLMKEKQTDLLKETH